MSENEIKTIPFSATKSCIPRLDYLKSFKDENILFVGSNQMSLLTMYYRGITLCTGNITQWIVLFFIAVILINSF